MCTHDTATFKPNGLLRVHPAREAEREQMGFHVPIRRICI